MAIYRVTGAGQFRSFVFPLNIPNKPFIARLAVAPGNEDIVVTGSSRLIRTTNFFSAPGVPDWFYDSPELDAAVSALAFAPSYPGGETVAFGTANGQVWLNFAGRDSANIDAGDAVPNRYVTAMAFHPRNANLLYVALSGFDEGTPGKPGHLFKSANALSAAPTWANISPPVNLPHNALVIDQGQTRAPPCSLSRPRL